MLFAERIPWFHSIDSVKELAAQRGAFAATLKVDSSIFSPQNCCNEKTSCEGEQGGDGRGEGGGGGGGEHPPGHLV